MLMRKFTGLVGFPLGHSISPAMHNEAFKQFGMDAEYLLFEVKEDVFNEKIQELKAPNFLGFNVTIPYKEKIIKLLDGIDPLASLIGAVNTVTNQKGKLIGFNTDGIGFIDSLKSESNFEPKGKSAVIIGAGGAARAVVIMLIKNLIDQVRIFDVDSQKSGNLAEYINKTFNCHCKSLSHEDLIKTIESSDLIVNATPIGMHPKIDTMPIPDKTKIPSDSVVYDLVYNPYETKLLKFAKKSGAKTISGIGMLVRQGAIAFSLFTGEKAPVDLMLNAAKKALRLI